jgi:hypothetical protein
MKDFLSMILDRKGRENEIHHPVTLDDVKKNPIVESYLAATDRHMSYLGYIEHGKRHASLVSSISYNILRRLGRSEREAELAGIAGYLHDLGSLINRHDHAKAGALLANQILLGMGMNPREVAEIVAAIGNHDENSFEPVSGITAALVLADKSDVHRSRVRSNETDKFSIYDRVNYAVENSFLRVDSDQREILLELTIDTEISQIMEYFQIFMDRMIASEKAANFLNCKFGLEINGQRMK